MLYSLFLDYKIHEFNLEACWLVNFVSGQMEFETSLEFGYKSENARINGFGFETESEVFSPRYWKIF